MADRSSDGRQAPSARRRAQGISIEQQNAIELILLGKSDQEVADTVGVHRVTVTRWRNYDPYFQAELNRQRKDLSAETRDRLRALVPKALERIEREVADGPMGVQVALQILKLSGLDQPSGKSGVLSDKMVGPDDPQAIIDEEARRRRGNPTAGILDTLSGGPITDQERDAVVADLRARIDRQ